METPRLKRPSDHGTQSSASRPRRAGLVAASLVVLAGATCLNAADIAVPNGSFEGQIAGPPFGVDNRIDDWQKTPQAPWFDPAMTGGTTWDQLSGVFANTPLSDPRYIDNMDGNQALYLFALPSVGCFQDYNSVDWNEIAPGHAFNASYEVGMSYDLTVGVIGGGGGMPEGDLLQLSFYYRDAGNNPVTVAATTIAHSTALFPTTTHFVDQQVTVPAVQSGDAWAGQKIGVQIVTLSGTGAGYWDLDNVRVTAAAIPEPGVASLLALGFAGLLLRRRPGRA
jgi:hypothetical protein